MSKKWIDKTRHILFHKMKKKKKIFIFDFNKLNTVTRHTYLTIYTYKNVSYIQ